MTIDTINQHIHTYAQKLPAAQIATQLNEAVKKHDAVVVTAPPGAGKSTLLPLTLLQALPPEGGKILMLEPRRLAARQIAERMAHMIGEKVGQTVGYRVRFETCISSHTRIEVLTEGILTRMLVDDATLEGVSIVVFDEFHERSLNTDLALALARQSQQIIRPDLRLVLMSATIDATEICKKLNAPLIESEGRMFPVKVIHADEDCAVQDCAQAVARTIRLAVHNDQGDVLAFLPGQADIVRCAELLANFPDEGIQVFPLYGNLSPEHQRQAIAPSAPGQRKVVLATPIAETSLTIEGVRIVVDAGLCRKLVYDPRTELSRLETVSISMDMATQRTGRAGRVTEGVCYRLWTRNAEHRMPLLRKPEIVEADLSQMVLNIAAFGESNLMQLPWLTPPPVEAVRLATSLLEQLGALHTNHTITPLGNKMAQLPCHPRVARMLWGSANLNNAQPLACDIAALLEEKDPLADTEAGADLTLRIAKLRQARANKQLGRWTHIAQIAHEYCRMIHTHEVNTDVAAECVGQLVALAYPERIGMALNGVGHFRLADGTNVMLNQADWISGCKWIAVASLHAAKGTHGRVFLAAPVLPSDLDKEGIVTTRNNLSWDNKQGCLIAQRERRIGVLVVDSQPLPQVEPEVLTEVICQAVSKYGQSMLSWDDHVQTLQRRIMQVAQWHPELQIANVSTEHLLRTATEWLPMYLNRNGRPLTTTTELKRIDLAEAIWNSLPYDQQQLIDHLAPTHITVPTGSRIRVDYRQGSEAPVLSVRLQECFGLEDTPCVDNNQRPVLMELLSPGFKPVQLTQDLRSFWQGTYFEVRKELRRRYPKHYWPENPLEAEAVRGVKRK